MRRKTVKKSYRGGKRVRRRGLQPTEEVFDEFHRLKLAAKWDIDDVVAATRSVDPHKGGLSEATVTAFDTRRFKGGGYDKATYQLLGRALTKDPNHFLKLLEDSTPLLDFSKLKRQLLDDTQVLSAVGEDRCALLKYWGDLPIEKILLNYHEDGTIFPRYDSTISKSVALALAYIRRREPEKFAELNDLREEPWGRQARIERIRWVHGKGHVMDLSPMRYLYYYSIHNGLMKYPKEFRPILDEHSHNALNWLESQSRPALPNHLTAHILLISSDNKVLIRKRDNTELYMGWWEASMGEMFHGPRYVGPHPHCEGENWFKTYVCNAIREEFEYDNVESGRIVVKGIAVEFEKLVPAILVLYYAPDTYERLKAKWESADKSASEVSCFPFTPSGYVNALHEKQLRYFTPLSNLVAMLGLVQGKNETERRTILEEVRVLYKRSQ